MQILKTTFIILLFGFPHLCLGQITYQPVFIHQVTNEVDTFSSFFASLEKDSIRHHTNFYKGDDSSSSILLPDTGIYYLDVHLKNFGKVRIIETGIIDTFYLPLILKFTEIGPAPPTYHYSYNHEPCNGKVTDYYFNGNIRVEGTFKDGLPTGDLKYYYRDGRLKKHEFYDGQIRIDYFENGTIESYSDFENDIYRDYYQNSQLKSVRIWKKRFRINYLKRNEEYYENGQHKYNQKKNAKIYYNEQGQVIRKVRRHEIFKLSRLYKQLLSRHHEHRTYEYKWTDYDKNRDKIIKYIYLKHIYQSFDKIGDKHLEVYLFKNNKSVIKIDWQYGTSDDELDHYIVYHRQNKEWIKGEKIEEAELFPTIERLQQELNNQ